MNKNVVLLICGMTLIGVTLGCTISTPTLNVGPLEEEKLGVATEGASTADVQLLMGAGELTISPGAEGVLDGTFHYNVKEWKPQIERNKIGNLVSVLVQQGPDKNKWGLAGRGARNEWDIRLGQDVPMRLTIGIGAGSSKLDLGGVRLSRLEVDGGAGDTSITFSAPNPEPLSEVQVNSGAGKIEMQSMGNANLEQLSIRGGAGEVLLDLRGDWTRSANVDVTAGVGKITVRIPREIGVKVRSGGSPVGKINVEGLQSTDGSYVNDVYDTAEIKLDISLATGVGDVTVTTR